MDEIVKIVKINDEAKNYEFKRYVLFKHVIYSFQYVDPFAENYKSKQNFILFKLGRIVVAILIWLIVGFTIYYSIETRNTTYIDALTSRDIIFIGRTLGSTW